MTLPTLITVAGTYLKVDGTPEKGYIQFASQGYTLSSGDNTIVVPSTITANLDPQGHVAVTLPANDPAWTPVGWTYVLMIQLEESFKSFQVVIPYDAPSAFVGLSSLIPAQPGGSQLYATYSHTHSQYITQAGLGTAVEDVLGNVLDAKADTVDLSSVAFSGSYADLINKPTLVTSYNQLTNKPNIITSYLDLTDKPALVTSYTQLTDKPNLITSYNDLTDKPTIVTSYLQLTDRPTLVTSYNDLTDKPTLVTSYTQLTNKPTIPSTYSDLTGTVPSASLPALTKSDVGLGNVDNTSDVNKPISSATQTALNSKVSGPASSVDNQLVLFSGTTGELVKASTATIDSNNDFSGIRRLTRTLGTDPATSGIERWDLNYAVSVSASDLQRIYVSSVLTCWRNEVGFLRGTPHAGYKDDALVRAIPRTDLTSENGGFIELQNSARTQVLYKRDWRTGSLWRGDGTAAASKMSDLIVLSAAAAVPAGLPANTVIVRTTT